MSSRSGAPAAASKLPLSGGIGTTPWSSTRSTSSVFRSTQRDHARRPGGPTRCRPGAASGRRPPGTAAGRSPRPRRSGRPARRRPARCSKSVMPRRAIAAWKSGSSRTSSSASISSETTAIGWMSVRRTQRVTVARVERDGRLDRLPAPPVEDHHLGLRGAGSPPPCPMPAAPRLSGSSSAIVTKRLSSPRLVLRGTRPADRARSHAASSGSSGWSRRALVFPPYGLVVWRIRSLPTSAQPATTGDVVNATTAVDS